VVQVVDQGGRNDEHRQQAQQHAATHNNTASSSQFSQYCEMCVGERAAPRRPRRPASLSPRAPLGSLRSAPPRQPCPSRRAARPASTRGEIRAQQLQQRLRGCEPLETCDEVREEHGQRGSPESRRRRSARPVGRAAAAAAPRPRSRSQQETPR